MIAEAAPVAAYMALTIALPALLGHQGQDWPPGVWWRTVRALRHRTPSENLPIPALMASRRRPQPSWALPPDPGPENTSPSPNPEKEPIT